MKGDKKVNGVLGEDFASLKLRDNSKTLKYSVSNGITTMDDAKFSSPMSVIGLYIMGAILVCLLLMPSIVNMNESELSANLASPTLMVITIIVNVSLQMSTGALFLFKVEHIIVCGLMSLLLAITACVKSAFPDYFSEHFRKSTRTNNPSISSGGLKSFHKELVSDYKWSIWGVVGMQIVTLIVGTALLPLSLDALPWPAKCMHSLKFVAMKQTGFLNFYKMFMFMRRNWNLYAKLELTFWFLNSIKPLKLLPLSMRELHRQMPLKLLPLKLVSRLNLVGANPLCFSSGKIKSFVNIDSVEEENQSVHNVSPVNESHFDGNFWFTTIRDDQTTEIPWTEPSIVNMNESELSANLASPTLMVITIIVNVSLQMSTGALFLFKVEHIIVCGLMSLLLATTACVKSAFPDYFSEHFRKSTRFSNKCHAWCAFHNLFCGFIEATIRAYRLEGLKSFHKELVSIINGQSGAWLECDCHLNNKLPEAIFDGMDDSVPTIKFERHVKLSMKLVSGLNLVGANPLYFSGGKIKSFMNIDSSGGRKPISS
ncbi:hypothetical protein Syun_031022 [Stephania yunnanensis]|uniref:Uncharacterized protein n=1 Tax=Stephania yunnanensis TaxID=152371 RepID=A0AAP0DVI8_9MAGN